MTDDPAYPTKIFATRSGTWKTGDDMGVEYIRWDIAARGDYHEGIEEGWKAGEAQERRIWEDAVRMSLGTIPEGLRNALEQVRAGVEGMMTDDSSYEHHPPARPLTVMRIDGLDWYSEDDWRALESERDALRAEMQELRAALKATEPPAEKAEAERDSYRKTANGMAERAAQAEARAEKADAKRDEYHAIGNAYAEWVGDILDLLEDRIDELDPDSPSDQKLRTLIDRAEAGIAAETRRALRKEGDE